MNDTSYDQISVAALIRQMQPTARPSSSTSKSSGFQSPGRWPGARRS
jgi:hypothetical protein